MKKKYLFLFCFFLSAGVTSAINKGKQKEITLSEKTILDKVKGAWAGKTLGCTYGGPTEFRFLGTIIQDYIPIPWDKDIVKKWYDIFPGLYDDVYVDLTFVDVFEKHGLDAPAEAFANAFKSTEYPLWHANQMTRYNLNQGLTPTQSGYWKNNPHANCIDFQIEADFAGIMSPGLPNQSALICDKVGHMFSYGSGWYGGVYVATMYTLAYISNDIEYIAEEALKIIPEQSDFYQCMSDVFKWYRKYPNDWKRTWYELQNKWSEEIGCPDGVHGPLNIGAKMNSAYVLIGLLYGQGDFTKTIDISTRCGQDSDCNPSTAAGILGTMLGYDNIPENWKEALYPVADIPFSNTDVSLNKAYDISYKHATAMILKNGGRKDGERYTFQIEKIKPVGYEVSFENLRVNDMLTVNQTTDNLQAYAFDGSGIVVKGYLNGNFPVGYDAKLEVYIDNKLIETSILPANDYRNSRKCELFFNYDLSVGHHLLSFKWLNPVENTNIWVTGIVTYTKK